jgi:hypothetical protein
VFHFFSSSYEFDLNIEMQLVPEMGRSPIANSLLPGSPFYGRNMSAGIHRVIDFSFSFFGAVKKKRE